MNESKLIEHYKNKYTNVEKDFRSKALRLLVADYIIPGSILDAGCGSGDVTLLLAEKGLDVTALDPISEMTDMTKALLAQHGRKDIPVIQDSIINYSKQKISTFNNIICLDVLEHIENDQESFNALINMLRPKGKLIISVPCLPWLYGPKDEAIGHYRRYSLEKLTSLVNLETNKIDALRYWNFIGVIPSIISIKIFNKAVPENFRYASHNVISRIINRLLFLWLHMVERHIFFPIGLSLIMIVTRDDKQPS